MPDVTIYHNPSCSKSRQALEFLQSKGIEPEIVEYLWVTPDADGLHTLLAQLGMEPHEFIRRKESMLAEKGIDIGALDDDALVDLMVEHPILIERPIVVCNGLARLGRPPERITEIL